jgi:hypothetical protein
MGVDHNYLVVHWLWIPLWHIRPYSVPDGRGCNNTTTCGSTEVDNVRFLVSLLYSRVRLHGKINQRLDANG